MAVIIDITPHHEPVSLARDMVDRAPGCSAGFYMLLDGDELVYDGCGMTKKDILWALERTKLRILSDKP
jgi:S-ribosylhomocysteine lyase LuxS involved in autoinducer biosynthesis